MWKRRLILGSILFVLSYVQFFIPKETTKPYTYIFWSLFIIGVILIFEAITIKICNESLINRIIKNKKNFLSFLLAAVMGAIVVELVANFLGKLWIYPYWSFFKYLIIFIPCVFIYWLLIVESYLATKAVVDLLHKGKKILKKGFKWERTFFKILGILGIILFIAAGVWIFQGYTSQEALFINSEDLNTKTPNYVVPFGSIILLFFGFWFIFEFIEYKKRETSLIKDIIHHYPTPLISIIVGSFVFALIMESYNLLYKLWVYVNWPLENITLIGLPIMMFVAWPLHYIAFLSFFRVINREESSEVWKGDTIK